jgi:hypothetical protein
MKNILILASVVVLGATTSCTRVYPGMVTTAASVKEGIIKKNVWIFGIGGANVDVSAYTAAKNAGITRIATVDRGVRYGLFRTTFITKVTGE